MADNIKVSGWLLKKKTRKGWAFWKGFTKRYCILDLMGGTFSYSDGPDKKEKKHHLLKDFTGNIKKKDLSKEDKDKVGEYRYKFLVDFAKRDYDFYATSEYEREKWYNAFLKLKYLKYSEDPNAVFTVLTAHNNATAGKTQVEETKTEIRKHNAS